MDRPDPTRPDGDEFAPDTRDRPGGRPTPARDIVRGDDPNRSEAPFGRPLGGGPPRGDQHDLSGGEHATDTATTYHGPPERPGEPR
jgi:hypothetical protein